MIKFVIAINLLYSMNLFAAVNLGWCASLVGADIDAYSNNVNHIPGANTFKVVSGKIQVVDTSKIVSKEILKDKEIYRYKVNIGDGVYEIRTLEISKDGSGNIVLSRKDDLEARKNLASRSGYDDRSNEDIPVRSGFEVRYSEDKSGKCELAQATALKSLNGKPTESEVFIDKKYCDDIKKITKDQGRAKVQQCVSLLEKADLIYYKRNAELNKEGKTFAEKENGFFGAATKIAMCSPSELQIRLDNIYNVSEWYGRGRRMYFIGSTENDVKDTKSSDQNRPTK
jgi:hypothetical protein